MNAKLWFRFILMGLMLSALVLAGCDDGDDGDDGAAGASAYDIAVENGYEGTFEEYTCLVTPGCGDSDVPTTAEPEQCAVCHSDVEAIHAATGVAVLTDVNGVYNATRMDYVIDFTLQVDGAATEENFTFYRAYVTYDDPTLDDGDPLPAITTNVRDTLYSRDRLDASAPAVNPGNIAFSSDGNGNYTVTVPPDSVVDNAMYTVILRDLDSTEDPTLPDEDGWGDTEPAALTQLNTSPLRDLVSDDGMSIGCASCHGASASTLFDHYLVAGNECQVCHAIYRRGAESIYRDATGALVSQGVLPGSNFTEYIHGIHNSHNMPEGIYYRTDAPDADVEEGDRFSIGYPSDMINCVSCHVTEDQLAAAVTAPVSFYLCMTCHQSWDGFVRPDDEGVNQPIFSADNFHRGADVETDCMSCHGAVPALDEVGDFHNAILDSARSNSFYRGENISFENPDDVDFEITGITSDGSNVSFTWTASDSSGAVDPCNMDTANGPTFQDLGAYLAYAKGDDWVNEFIRDAPGQPAGSDGLFDDLTTTCAANVATTTGLVLNPDATSTYADRVLLALGGKPFANFSGDDATGDYAVRVSSPTQAFDPATGDFLADRRDAVNNDKCLGCHQGTLYQHGGDRVDNEQLCVICHNPAASDKNVRLDTFQVVNEDGTVNTDATYDGKNAETYDMRTMLHAIHGVEARLATGGKPWVVYRGRGIYGFGLDDTPLPAGWPADGETVNGSTNDGTTPHNWVVVHYPKAVNDCDACHNDGQYEAADQTKAVGVTDDAGFDWPDQSDDIIIGPSAAACTACHAGAAQRSHAQSNGYRAKVTKDEMLEKAN